MRNYLNLEPNAGSIEHKRSEEVHIMKSYKLNKTFENSTYPLEQQLRKLVKLNKTNTSDIIISVTSVLFSGLAGNLYCQYIFETKSDCDFIAKKMHLYRR
jgi:hypothetical protein